LLSHPKGGALAVIGRIDRAWGSSFNEGGISNIGTFINAIKRLMHGYPVGAAMDFFNQRYAELASDLSLMSLKREQGGMIQPLELSNLKTATLDARNYIVIGDPAVRVMVEDSDEHL
jgi:hypothetical protein